MEAEIRTECGTVGRAWCADYASLTLFPDARRLSGRALGRWKQRCEDNARWHHPPTRSRYRGNARDSRYTLDGWRGGVTRPTPTVKPTTGGTGRRHRCLLRRPLRRTREHRRLYRATEGTAGHPHPLETERGIEQWLETGAAEAPQRDDGCDGARDAKTEGRTGHSGKVVCLATIR